MLMSSPIEQYNVFRKDVSSGTFESQPTRYKLTVDLQTKEKKQYARFQFAADYPVPTKELTTIQLEIEFKHILSCSDFRITKTPEGLVESSTLNKEAEEWALDDPAKIFQRFDALPKIRRLFMRCRLPGKSPKEPGTE